MHILDDKASENMGLEKMERISNTRFFFQKFDRDHWEEATKSTLKTRILLTLLAIGLLVATVVDYIYLGGYEAIISGDMPGVHDWFDYAVEIGCLLVMPVLAVFFLSRVFKNKV